MGDAATDPKPLEVPLTGHRRILLDVDGADWRVAFYYPARFVSSGPHPKIATLEKRARTGSQKDRSELEGLDMARNTGRAPELSEALRKAMTVTKTDRYGEPHTVLASQRELDTITRYVLEGRYAERMQRAS